MTDLYEPEWVYELWLVPGADRRVRVRLSLRNAIKHYYTGLEVYAPELGDGIWKHVTGTADGHGTSRAKAEERVLRLLNGQWRDYVDAKLERVG